MPVNYEAFKNEQRWSLVLCSADSSISSLLSQLMLVILRLFRSRQFQARGVVARAGRRSIACFCFPHARWLFSPVASGERLLVLSSSWWRHIYIIHTYTLGNDERTCENICFFSQPFDRRACLCRGCLTDAGRRKL